MILITQVFGVWVADTYGRRQEQNGASPVNKHETKL
jgi:hypothetical protein